MTSIPAIWGALLLLAVVMGVSGTLYKVLGPEGWMAAAFQDGPKFGLLVFAVLAAACVLWLSATSARRKEWRSIAFVYACAGAGVYYLAQLIAHGNL